MNLPDSPESVFATGPAVLKQLHQLYALRANVEGFAARRAATEVASGRSADALTRCYLQMQEAAASGSYENFQQADMAFHRTIAVLADVPALVEIWDIIELRMRQFVAWAHRRVLRDIVAIAHSHHLHYNAICDGNPREAERAAMVGLDSLWQILTEQAAESGNTPDPLEHVYAYITLNLHKPLLLTQVAKEVAFLSPSHLAKLFRDTRKESFTSYVTGLRLRRAAHLLASTSLSIQEIVDRVGASDLSRFAIKFREVHGCAPSAFRRKSKLDLETATERDGTRTGLPENNHEALIAEGGIGITIDIA